MTHPNPSGPTEAVNAHVVNAVSGILSSLLSPESIARRIQFHGNVPRLDPLYKAQIVGAVLGSTVAEVTEAVASGSPLKLITRNLWRILRIPANVKKIVLNRRYKIELGKRLDRLAADIQTVENRVDRAVDGELFESSVSMCCTLARDRIEDLWSSYNRKYNAVWI